MTIGIYRLKFKNTDKCYIGQSIQIETRYKQHINSMRKGIANPKLVLAYNTYGIPELDILCECLAEELNKTENEAIEIFNSVENGFNVNQFAEECPNLHGEQHGMAKHLNSQIIEVFHMLVTTDMSAENISNITNVTLDVVKDVSALKTHKWLEEEFPKEYTTLKSLKGTRNTSFKQTEYSRESLEKAFLLIVNSLHTSYREIGTITNISENVIEQMARGISHKWLKEVYPQEYFKLENMMGKRKQQAMLSQINPKVKNPEGVEYDINIVSSFAKLHNLNCSTLHKLLRGEVSHHKHWVLA